MRSPNHVVVVGNGALGLFLAKRLAETGQVDVTVVGPPNRDGGASIAAGAMLGLFGEVTKDTFSTAHGRAKFELGLNAHRQWPAVLQELQEFASKDEPLHYVKGTHVVLNGCGGILDSKNYDAITAALNRYDIVWHTAEENEIPGYCPRMNGRALRALHIPGEGAIDGNQVLRLLEHCCETRGVKTIHSTATRLLSRGNRVSGVNCDGYDVLADVVVVAAGANSRELLLSVIGPEKLQPLLAGAGLSVVVERGKQEPFETVVRTPNRGGACGLHLVPLGGNREYIGASNVIFGRQQKRPTVAACLAMLEQIGPQLNDHISDRTFIEWRSGNRPVPLDGYPLIGWCALDGLYVTTGTYRDGFHAGPAVAEHAVDEIIEGSTRWNLPFSPTRDPVTNWTVDESIAEYALHMTDLWYETSGRMPHQIPSDFLYDNYRKEAAAMYERTGISIGLNPDVVCYLVNTRTPGEIISVFRYLHMNNLIDRTSGLR